jgi:hypothetical protein
MSSVGARLLAQEYVRDLLGPDALAVPDPWAGPTTEVTMPARAIRGDFELFVRPCSHCRERIMWAKTNASGRREWMPLDYDPAPRGNVLAYPAPDDRRLLVCDVLPDRGAGARRVEQMRRDGWLLFLHHRLSCPKADQWARGPLSTRPQPTGIARMPEPTPDPEPDGLFPI